MTSNLPILSPAHRTREAFTLIELLVSVAVLVIIVLTVAQLMSSATAITRVGNKRIDTDTQARAVFDRLAVDIAQMVQRTDVDYYVKGWNYTGHGNGHGYGRGRNGDLGSDQIAFFTQAPGYYPSGSPSPISLVAYRVNESSSNNQAYLKLERMGKGLLWNGASNSNPSIVFLPVTIRSLWPQAVNNNNNCGGSANSSCDPDYEIIGPGVFRFEYYYILKNGRATDIPWNADAGHTSLTGIGLGDIEAIGVTIAVIDSAGRALIDAANSGSLLDLANDFTDFRGTRGRGVGNQNKYIGALEADWETTVQDIVSAGQTSAGLPIPPEAAKTIRIYGKSFDLKTPPAF
jgi:prepilin-type N-terminal cleavage/methylation domain-containing protein